MTMVTIALPAAAGLTHKEIARQLGRSESWVSAELAKLRREIDRARPTEPR